MEEYQLAILVTTFILFLIFLGFLVWGIISGQFTDIEAPKYRMLKGNEMSDIKEDAKEE
jgi:cbb3-type cytochrome oxidase maturation protein